MTELKDDRRFHNLTQEQVETLDQVLTEVIPIHGRGNFPTLEIKPKDIIHIVREKLISKNIKVRDVRLNGSTASHVLVKENGTSYKDLDIIFGVELPKQEDFQIIKEVVLGCLLDFLPQGVNKDKITALTMKEAYVQKMVKVFTEHDRWSLISLSNNSGKNVELKFVSSLRRQFEFSVDSFQIILDTMLESYLEAERKEAAQHKEKEENLPLNQKSGSQSGSLRDQTITSNIESQSEPDIDMSGERKGIPSVHDCACHSETVLMEDQNKPSTEELNIEISQKEDNEELGKSIEITEAAEQESEQSFSKIVLMKETNKHENTFLDKEEMLKEEANSDEDNTAMQTENEQMVTVKSKNNEESETQLSTPQMNFGMEVSKEKENVSAAEPPICPKTLAPPNVESTPEMELTDPTCEPMQITEKTSEPTILTQQCIFKPPPITFPTQATVDLNNEYPLPPPAKKTSRSSQMVVLKHSSPKPPRKMSRKVTCVAQSAEKSMSKDSIVKSCQLVSHLLKPSDQKESMSMQVELPGLTTNCFESLSSASDEKDSLSRILDLSTPAFSVARQENGKPSEETLSLCLVPEESILSQVQSSEPETGETTVLSPSSKPFSAPQGQASKIQPCLDKVTKTYVQPVKPVIQINSQPIVQVDDSPVLRPNCHPEVAAELVAQTAECTQEHNESQKTVTHTIDSSSNSLLPLSTNITIDSKEVETTPQGLELPAIATKVLEPSILQPQEPTVPCIDALESPVLISNLLEPPILLPQTQDCSALSVNFPNTPEISCLLKPPMSSSENQGYSVWPPTALKSSTLPMEGSASSLVSLQALETPKVFTQTMESCIKSSQAVPPSPSSSNILPTTLSKDQQPPIAPQLQTPVETTQSSNPSHSEAKKPLPPPREVPSVTVVAESMYGDFEQAMDHLRYRLIATRNPEEIRGGGLLKYSNLLVRDFKPASETEIKTLERYMCSRFFIDFPDVNEQQRKIESYLRNHFIGEEKSKYDYLMTLRRVVNESTVCLMGHERRQTLNMITILALKVLGEQNIIPNTNNVTCYYQPAPYMADHNFSNYYIANGQSPLIYHPYPLHIHMQTGLV